MVKLSVIIVVYNGFSYLQKCLNSLYQNKIPHMEIIVIDNASTETGLEKFLSNFPDIIFIKNPKNLGFAKGINIGLKQAKGIYVLILNPDTIILPDTLPYVLHKMDDDNSIALAGCKIVDQEKHLSQSAGYRFPNIFSHLYEYNYPFYRLLKLLFPQYHPLLYTKAQHTKEMQVKHLVGAFLLIRKSVLKKTGNFDERYFLYKEETDFCKKVIDNGFTIAYLPEKGGIVHIGGRSSKVKITQSSPFYMQSTYRFFIKYHSKLYVLLVYIVGTFSAGASFMYFFLRNKVKRNHYIQENYNAWKAAFLWHIKKIERN